MTIKLKIAWILSILATALVSVGLVGNGTFASFSDTVTVTHKIQTGQLKLRIVTVDGTALDRPAQEYGMSDRITASDVDITRVLELRNQGTVDIGAVYLTATPTHGDSTVLAEALRLSVRLDDAPGSELAMSLADWEDAPRQLDLPSTLRPGESVTVSMHTTGNVDLSEEAAVEPVYTFTAASGD